ncbi:hypothetical protein HELRODRAFT_188459 [Helobdella robusta]|uniref:Uncharacterized protein n=1 Tax=Helobdella robusta TaxID=6412 RepID=T1FQ05_HELRO|nr:hypothetical protein HELRODRAFT_188459 [Helobdella robusta]ESO06701.1 hypothetical protein HELRODRAFT_188459 [Helobdella robusta]
MNVFEQLESIYTNAKLDLDKLVNHQEAMDPQTVQSVTSSLQKMSDDIKELKIKAEKKLAEIELDNNSYEMSQMQARSALNVNKEKLIRLLPELKDTLFKDDDDGEKDAGDLEGRESDYFESCKENQPDGAVVTDVPEHTDDFVNLENADEFMRKIKQDILRVRNKYCTPSSDLPPSADLDKKSKETLSTEHQETMNKMSELTSTLSLVDGNDRNIPDELFKNRPVEPKVSILKTSSLNKQMKFSNRHTTRVQFSDNSNTTVSTAAHHEAAANGDSHFQYGVQSVKDPKAKHRLDFSQKQNTETTSLYPDYESYLRSFNKPK